MFDTDKMEYRITEDEFNDLANARHLISVLEDLSNAGIHEHTVTLNRESLSAVLSSVGETMDKALPDLCPHRINNQATNKETEES